VVFENLLAPVCTMTKRKFIFWFRATNLI
jgi:hypothetical protein